MDAFLDVQIAYLARAELFHIPLTLIVILCAAHKVVASWFSTADDRRRPHFLLAPATFAATLICLGVWVLGNAPWWALTAVLYALCTLILTLRPAVHSWRRRRDAAQPTDPSFVRGFHHNDVLEAIRLGKHRTADIVRHCDRSRRDVNETLKDLRDRAGLVTSPAFGRWRLVPEPPVTPLTETDPRQR